MQTLFSNPINNNSLHSLHNSDLHKLLYNFSCFVGRADYLANAKEVFPTSAQDPNNSELFLSLIDMRKSNPLFSGILNIVALQEGYRAGYCISSHPTEKDGANDAYVKIGVFRKFQDNADYEMLCTKQLAKPPVVASQTTTIKSLYFDEKTGHFRPYTQVQTNDLILMQDKVNGLQAFSINTEQCSLNPFKEEVSLSCLKQFHSNTNILDERLALSQLGRFNITTPDAVNRHNYLSFLLEKIISFVFPAIYQCRDANRVTPYFDYKTLSMMNRELSRISQGFERPVTDRDSPFFLYQKGLIDALQFLKAFSEMERGTLCSTVNLLSVSQDSFELERGFDISFNQGFIYYAVERPLNDFMFIPLFQSMLQNRYVDYGEAKYIREINGNAYGYTETPIPVSKDDCEGLGLKASPFNHNEVEFYQECVKQGVTKNDFLKRDKDMMLDNRDRNETAKAKETDKSIKEERII